MANHSECVRNLAADHAECVRVVMLRRGRALLALAPYGGRSGARVSPRSLGGHPATGLLPLRRPSGSHPPAPRGSYAPRPRPCLGLPARAALPRCCRPLFFARPCAPLFLMCAPRWLTIPCVCAPGSGYALRLVLPRVPAPRPASASSLPASCLLRVPALLYVWRRLGAP